MPSRPSTAPNTGATVLVTQYGYDSISGRLQLVTNPKGQQTKTWYDALSRTTFVAENYDNFSPPSTNTGDPTDPSKDRVTQFVYNGLGQKTSQVALDEAGNGGSNNETTTYLYEDPYNAALVTSTIYPDSSDTNSSGTNQVKVQYNLDGLPSQKTDQRGTVIQYSYNDSRQLSLEGVTTLGGSTDGTVRSIGRAYDSLGRLTTITSTSAADGTGTIVNQVVQSYADYGPVATEWQSHSGAAVTSGSNQTLNVQYGFDTTADANGIYQNALRLQQVTYPNSRVIYYQYGSSGDLNDLMRRITQIYNTNASGQLLAQYSYLPSPSGRGAGGEGGIVRTDYAEPQLCYTLSPGGTAGVYDGLDQFGRVQNLLWLKSNTSTNLVQIQHGYDYAGNRVWRADPIAASNNVYLDEYYSYDGLNRLTDLQRGQLNTGKTGISGTPAWEEAFTLDGLGNWPGYVQNVNGTNSLNQTRTHDLANKITQINSSSTSVGYDLAGSMTTMPTPGNWGNQYQLVYDAWNRLVKVLASDGVTNIAQYQYDGRNYRTVKQTYTSGALSETRDFFYNSDWQCLEERIESGGTIASTANRQNVWGLRYIDDLILRDRDADSSPSTGNLGITGSGLEERLYAMQDPNWNVAAIADTTGTVQERYSFTGYGTPAFLSSAFASNTPNASNYAWDSLYTGRQYDPETAIYNLRNRLYGAEIGRFLTRDPIGYNGGINLFGYVQDLPVTRTDPNGTGLWSLMKCLWQLNKWEDKIKKEQEECKKKQCKLKPNDPWSQVKSMQLEKECQLKGLSLSSAALKACLEAVSP